MIPELDRHHGVVLRQILVAFGAPITLAVADSSGRIDAFSLNGSAFQIKHSSKRLSPWQFTFLPENLEELRVLQARYSPVWLMLVCGIDGVVGLSAEELFSIVSIGGGGAGTLRISRSRNSMYRVVGSNGELPRAKARGVSGFVDAIVASQSGKHQE